MPKKNLNELNAKQRLEVVQLCRRNKEESFVIDRNLIILPIFLTLKFQCIDDITHTRIIIVSRIDYINEHIRVIQECLQCKGKMNLVGVN